MANDRIKTDPPEARTIDIDQIVDSIDPDPGFTEVYPARHLGETGFIEYDPYEWTEDNAI